MPTKTLTLLMIGLIACGHAAADVTTPSQTHDVKKIKTIQKMYEQDISHQGMESPAVLQQYANSELKAAMQLEQDYFDKEQMSCHVGYDVLWNSQDPDYKQDKQFLITEKGLVQVRLAQGEEVYYDLSCEHTHEDVECQVADVILDGSGKSLRQHLLETCR